MVRVSRLISAAIAPVTSAIIKTTNPRKAFHARVITSAGAGSATVLILASNDLGVSWVTLATLSLTAATTYAAGVQAGYNTDAAYETFAMQLTAISGTGAVLDGYASN